MSIIKTKGFLFPFLKKIDNTEEIQELSPRHCYSRVPTISIGTNIFALFE